MKKKGLPKTAPVIKDWTEHAGGANTSETYLSVVTAVESMLLNIRLGDNTHSAARFIVSQLAHVYGLAPRRKMK